MSSPDVDDDVLKNSASVEVTGQIMVIAIIVLFFVVVFILFLHLYAKWFWWRIEQHPRDPNSSSVRRPGGRRRRFVFAPGQDPAAALRAGLNPAILKKIPVVGFSQQEFKDGLECAVCLCELEDGEKARLLPKCNHGFHVECIDMWFQSHSTCPLCRNPVNIVDDDDKSSVEIDMQSTQESSATDSSTNFPTNVLFWGDDTQVSSASAAACLQEVVSTSSYSLSSSSATSSSTETSSNSRRSGGPEMVIEIPPSTVSEHLSSLSPEEESKTPVATRLRSLKRLLSRE